ncbi:hypothetical protein HQ39_06725 [Porphyromonas sp. COT-108 OH2963]|nr:hypothetical protein HQ39_06725 [Porphyromonas sp. COT-108 OH2963]
MLDEKRGKRVKKFCRYGSIKGVKRLKFLDRGSTSTKQGLVSKNQTTIFGDQALFLSLVSV